MNGTASFDSDRNGRATGSRSVVASLLSLDYLFPFGLLLVAFLFGGSSAGQPLRDMAIELFAVLVLAATALGWIGGAWSEDARIPFALIAALVLLMVLQLVPLPSGLWTGLSGRDFSAQVLAQIGAGERPLPLSLQPDRTMLSALALLPGVAMALAVMRLASPHRIALAWAVVVAALASLLFGIVQSSVGGAAPQITLYATSHAGQPIGVFANTNHQADLLLVGFVMAGSLAPPLRLSGRSWIEQPFWIYGVMAALAVGIVATGSRTGIVLLGVGLIAIVLRERLSGHVRSFLIGGAVLAAALVLLVLFNPVFARSFADFSDLDDPRFHFWPNVLWAIDHFGWLGTGAGTFDGVYRSAETLDTLSSNYVNHAHNDYLEILLETGIPGAVLLLVFMVFLVWRGVGIIRRTDARVGRSLAYGGMTCVGLLMLHSLVDYPLRTPLLAVLFGLFVGLMTRSPRPATVSTVQNRAPAGAPSG